MRDDPRPEFSVFQIFRDETCEAVLRLVDRDTAVRMAQQLIRTVGAKVGTARRVVTDGGDHTVLEWPFGHGIAFPPHDDDGRDEEQA